MRHITKIIKRREFLDYYNAATSIAVVIMLIYLTFFWCWQLMLFASLLLLLRLILEKSLIPKYLRGYTGSEMKLVRYVLVNDDWQPESFNHFDWDVRVTGVRETLMNGDMDQFIKDLTTYRKVTKAIKHIKENKWD